MIERFHPRFVDFIRFLLEMDDQFPKKYLQKASSRMKKNPNFSDEEKSPTSQVNLAVNDEFNGNTRQVSENAEIPDCVMTWKRIPGFHSWDKRQLVHSSRDVLQSRISMFFLLGICEGLSVFSTCSTH